MMGGIVPDVRLGPEPTLNMSHCATIRCAALVSASRPEARSFISTLYPSFNQGGLLTWCYLGEGFRYSLTILTTRRTIRNALAAATHLQSVEGLVHTIETLLPATPFEGWKSPQLIFGGRRREGLIQAELRVEGSLDHPFCACPVAAQVSSSTFQVFECAYWQDV